MRRSCTPYTKACSAGIKLRSLLRPCSPPHSSMGIPTPSRFTFTIVTNTIRTTRSLTSAPHSTYAVCLLRCHYCHLTHLYSSTHSPLPHQFYTTLTSEHCQWSGIGPVIVYPRPHAQPATPARPSPTAPQCSSPRAIHPSLALREHSVQASQQATQGQSSHPASTRPCSMYHTPPRRRPVSLQDAAQCGSQKGGAKRRLHRRVGKIPGEQGERTDAGRPC